MKRTTKRATIALDLASLDAPGLVSFTRTLAKGLDPTTNTNFTAADLAKLPFTAAQILASATTLETTHTSRGTTPSKSSTKVERDQADTLMDQITDVAHSVESFANQKAAGDITVAEAIITSTGFKVKKPRAAKTQVGFDADSPTKGTAQVDLPKGPENAVSVVIYSTDGWKTSSFPIIVHGRVLILTGLKSGNEVGFKHATIPAPPRKGKTTITAGSEEPTWSNVVSCVVK